MGDVASIIVSFLKENPNWETILKISKSNIHDEEIDMDSEETRAYEMARLLNQNVFDYGSRRVVLDYEKDIVKIPLEAMGLMENLNELTVWETANDNVKKYLTPCMGGDEFIAIFKKVELVSHKEFDDRQEEILSIINFLKGEGYVNSDSEESRFDQWGKIGNQLVLVDYGAIFNLEENKTKKHD